MSSLGAFYAQHLQTYSEAATYFTQALVINREIGNLEGESNDLSSLSVTARFQGDNASSKIYLREALAICQKIGHRQLEAFIQNSLGRVCWVLGDCAQAKMHFEKALLAYHQVDHQGGQTHVLVSLDLLSQHLGDKQAVQQYEQQGVSIFGESNYYSIQANFLTHTGHAMLEGGRLAEAADAYRQALYTRRKYNEHDLAIENLAGLANVSLKLGDSAQALEWTEKVLICLGSNVLEKMQKPFTVYLVCYRVLQANEDARAPGILSAAYNLLQEQACKINDEKMRRSFLESIATHREIVAEWQRAARKSL